MSDDSPLSLATLLATAYFVTWHTSQLLLGGVAGLFVWRYYRRRTRRNRALAERLAAPPLVSIVVSAYNEELTIVESVRALLALDYEAREIVIVNDGSIDRTLPLLIETFQMLSAPLAFAEPLPSAPLRGSYRSVVEPQLIVVDKENGGCKADATNAGINAASGVLVLLIDADTVLEPDALSRAVLPFLEDPATIAVGGHIAIINGCSIDDSRIVDVALPASWLARFQIVEYLRSFLLFRLACASRNAVTIISGAFGLFLREAVVACGGYDVTAIGEDMDLTLRLQKFYRQRRLPFRIRFGPYPICHTQAPEDWASLRSQRQRWRRGLLQALWRQRGMIGNPRYGILGVLVLPYSVAFEVVAPLLEVSGLVIGTIAAAVGVLNWPHYKALLAASVLYGAAVTLFAVLLDDLTTHRYRRTRDLLLLMAVAVIENCGYRQLNSWWGCVGTIQALSGKGGWGVMKRKTFEAG